MTLLKRKSALWHGRGYSPPGLGFRTPEDRSGSVSPKREHIQPGCDARYLLGGVVGDRGASERRWVGGRWWLEGSSLSQLSPQCSCIYHNSGGTIFTKPPTQCPDSKSRLKTSAESTLKGKRFSICDTTTALTLLFLSRSPTLWPDICQVCVKKERRPISPPPLFFSSSSSPSLLLHSAFHSLAGRVALLSLHRQDLWSQGLWQKQKGICQYLWETLCQPASFHWCSQPH